MKICRPEEKYFDEYLSACRDAYENWKKYAMTQFDMLENSENLPPEIPKMYTYWFIDDEKFIGEMQLRPVLSDSQKKSIGLSAAR